MVTEDEIRHKAVCQLSVLRHRLLEGGHQNGLGSNDNPVIEQHVSQLFNSWAVDMQPRYATRLDKSWEPLVGGHGTAHELESLVGMVA